MVKSIRESNAEKYLRRVKAEVEGYEQNGVY